jgi:hypothetical protein
LNIFYVLFTGSSSALDQASTDAELEASGLAKHDVSLVLDLKNALHRKGIEQFSMEFLESSEILISRHGRATHSQPFEKRW